jgi:hypothetical protein
MRRYGVTSLLFILLVFSGCQSGAGPLPLGTFVNESDRSQVLEITLDPSQTPNVLLRISMESRANHYFGKSLGKYVLKTDRGTATGTFVWAKSPCDGCLHEVWFTADAGKRWTMTVQPDSSLSDGNGVIWKRL